MSCVSQRAFRSSYLRIFCSHVMAALTTGPQMSRKDELSSTFRTRLKSIVPAVIKIHAFLKQEEGADEC